MYDVLFWYICRLRHSTSMTALEQTNQHLHGAWKLESPFWTKNSLMLQWPLIQSGKWYWNGHSTNWVWMLFKITLVSHHAFQSISDKARRRAHGEMGSEEGLR
jgi:hypothetical protein